MRRVVDNTGMSLNDYVVSSSVAAATEDLADQRAFSLSPEVWDELQDLLDRPVAAKPKINALLAEPSVLTA